VTARYAAAMILLAALAAAAIGLWGGRLGAAQRQGLLLGLALATVGAVSGLVLTAWSFDKGPRLFFAALVIGILGRLFLYGAALIYVALRTTVEPTAAAIGLLGSYVPFQAIEVRFALRGLLRPRGRGTGMDDGVRGGEEPWRGR
jgi:hypothetical protein